MSKTNLMAASNQWATRPADERFWNLPHLLKTLEVRKGTTATAQPKMMDLKAVETNNNLCIQGTTGASAQLSHWSFSQLCARIKAPAEYLRSLPTKMAAELVNHGMKNSPEDQPAQLLLSRNESGNTVRAITTDYDRLWNIDIVRALIPGLQNGWMTPPARPVHNIQDDRARPATAEDIVPGQENFGLAVKVGDMIAPAGVYEGDRDMFLFLVNPNRTIDDGNMGMMRGVFIWNSEVGAGAFKMKTFLLENVCSNHICWGASKVSDFRLIHRGDKIKLFAQRMAHALRAATPTDLTKEENMLKAARIQILGKDKEEVIKTLYERKSLGMTKKNIEESFKWAERYEHTARCSPTTVWGFVHGLTRYSQTMPYADERNELDAAGGKILDFVTVA